MRTARFLVSSAVETGVCSFGTEVVSHDLARADLSRVAGAVTYVQDEMSGADRSRNRCAFSPRLLAAPMRVFTARPGSPYARALGMRLRKILCPIDFSRDSTSAMRAAIRLANDHAAELVLAHVFQPPITLTIEQPVMPSEIYTTLAKDASSGLDQAVAQATELGANRVTGELKNGVAWIELVEMLERDASFDLVVMGTHGRTGISRMLLGSVTEKVVRHAPCSVLTLRRDAAVAPFTKILCPIDFSDTSEIAMDFAAELRPKSITLLHVIEVIMPYSGEPFPAVYTDDIQQQATEELDRAATVVRKLAEVPVETTTREGRAGHEVVEMLDENPGFDLVVIGSHGRTGIKRALLGSVAEVVVRHARCPVVVARVR